MNIRVAVGDDSVESDLVQVGGLELEHLVDASPVDRICSFGDLLGCTVGAAETSLDQLLAVLVEQVEGGQMGTSGDLDQLCETVSDLGSRQSAEEGEIEECVHWCMVGAQAVLVVAVVDGDLDGNGGVDQTNNRGGHTDEVGVSAVGCASESVNGQ